MSEKILILGSNHDNTAVAYKKFGLPQSTLVNSVSLEFQVGHTARQDFCTDHDLEQVLKKADKVFWADSDWQEFNSKEIYYEFLEWLKKYQHSHGNIVNFNQIKVDPYRWKSQLPELTANDMVFLGCSFTAGAGLSDSNTHYASILAKHFHKNKINLSQPGGSNYRSFDIFSQLDFHPGQLVVLQLTELARLRYCSDDKLLQEIPLASSKSTTSAMLELYNDNFLLYEQLVQLRLVIKLAREKNLRLIFWLIDYKDKNLYSKECQMYFYEFKEFIPAYAIENFIVDLAEDKVHPGIESNRILATAIIQHIERTYPNV
jgi:hypothetical protein